MRNIVLISQVAITMLSPIFVGLFIGGLLDKWLKLNGVFTIILLLLGVVSGFVSTYKLIKQMNQTENDDNFEGTMRKKDGKANDE